MVKFFQQLFDIIISFVRDLVVIIKQNSDYIRIWKKIKLFGKYSYPLILFVCFLNTRVIFKKMKLYKHMKPLLWSVRITMKV